MTCSCLQKFDELLRPRNTRLQTALVYGRDENNAGQLLAVPHIGTEQIEKGRGKAKALAVSPTFCPFCGTAYELPKSLGLAVPEGGAA